MQKLNRYLLETDAQRASFRTRRPDFEQYTCSNCGWSIDPTTPHWTPDGGHSGGIYHIHCYTPGLPTPAGRSRKAWQCFCGHECRCMEYSNKTGYYGAGCDNCDGNHYGDDTDYEYNKMPHECSLCGWTILAIDIPILNKHKLNYDFPLGWMHECCYIDRVDELDKLNEEYIPITLTLPEGKINPDDLDEDEWGDDKDRWRSSIKEQERLVSELEIWQKFGVERIPI